MKMMFFLLVLRIKSRPAIYFLTAQAMKSQNSICMVPMHQLAIMIMVVLCNQQHRETDAESDIHTDCADISSKQTVI